MNKRLKIIFAIVAVIIIGFIGYTAYNKAFSAPKKEVSWSTFKGYVEAQLPEKIEEGTTDNNDNNNEDNNEGAPLNKEFAEGMDERT